MWTMVFLEQPQCSKVRIKFDTIHRQRLQHLYQIALGVVLFRYQYSQKRHFHWEQPRRSLMFMTPLLREIYEYTYSAKFDLCNVGSLKDPENHRFIQKGLEVRTTSYFVYSQLHGRYCRHDHEHQVLEGSTVHNGVRKNRTEFSEIYPRKFARSLAKMLTSFANIRTEPKEFSQWKEVFAAAVKRQSSDRAGTKESPAKRIRANTARRREPPADSNKRRRKGDVESKESHMTQRDNLYELCEKVHRNLPRVGRREVFDPEIIQSIQEAFGEKKVVRVLACKGTERMLPPPQNMMHGEAPFRRTIALERGTKRVWVQNEWEEWETISQRQLIRGLIPCAVNITVFGCNPSEASPSSAEIQPKQESQSQVPEGQLHSTPVQETTAQDSVADPSTCKHGTEPLDQDMFSRNLQIDCEGSNQGPKFKALSGYEKQTLLRLHKNLGHPSPQVLAQVLRQQGYPSHLIRGLEDMKCSTCIQHQAPKIQRPATLKSELDFGDKISVDGITWHNKNKERFHFYHYIDHGTNYHTATIAPNRTTEWAMEKITVGWLSWAGPPNEVVADSATEFNNPEFAQFLRQFNTKLTIIPPQAHWQLGKTERHGDVLQHMLNKYQEDFPIENYSDLQRALTVCTAAKNACSLRHGFAPEVLVFGKGLKVPGSLTSDDTLPAHSLANEDTAWGIKFRTQLAMRESARKAFHEADNKAALRRAALRRERPSRGFYNPGEWIMYWRSGEATKGWNGPAKVVQQDGRSSVFCLHRGTLVRAAPEHVRPVSALEAQEIPHVVPPNQDEQTHMSRLVNHMQSSRDETLNPNIPNDIIQNNNLSNNNITGPQRTMPDTMQSIPEGDNPEGENQNLSPNSHSSVQPDQEPELEVQQSPTEINNPNIAIETPVPDDDDELICDLLTCTDVNVEMPGAPDSNYAWRMELDVPEVISNDSYMPIEDLICVATNQKKQRTEVKLSTLSPEEKEEFEKAKLSEVNNWLQTGTVSKVLRDQLSPEQILRCRWIHVWKPIEDPKDQQRLGKSRKAKSRLVVLGYLDPELETIPRDSRQSRMLILQMIASLEWTLRSFDIKAAFLQGRTQENRTIAIEPVPELSKAMNLKEKEVCLLEKSAYGLIDAPYLWYKELDRVLRKLSFIPSPFDPCVYLLYKEGFNKPSGVIGMHVDDGLCGGDAFFDEQLSKLEAIFPFGAKKTQSFTFTGIEMNQLPNKTIILSQEKYITKIEPIHIKPDRKEMTESKINEEGRLSLRALIGSLQYASVNTRPDLASRLSHLQSSINTATISTLNEANKVLHNAKKHKDITIKIQPIDFQKIRFLAFSDASFSSKKQPDSHTGMIIMTTHADIAKNHQCPVNPISWGCKKIQKVVVSTLSAETMSLNSTLDQLSYLHLYWGWFQNPWINWKQSKQTLKELPPTYAAPTVKEDVNSIAVTDCKSLYDLVTRTAPPSCQEFRTQLQARAIKDLLSENVTLRWVHSGAQVADALTKIMECAFLRHVLTVGHYRLHDEDQTLKDRATSRNRMQWLQQETKNKNSWNFHVLGVWISNNFLPCSTIRSPVMHSCEPMFILPQTLLLWSAKGGSGRWIPLEP